MDFLNRLKNNITSIFKPIATSTPFGAAGNLMNSIGGSAMNQQPVKTQETFTQTVDNSVPKPTNYLPQNNNTQQQNTPTFSNPTITDDTFKIDTSNVNSKNLTPDKTVNDVLNYRKEIEARYAPLLEQYQAQLNNPNYLQAQENLITANAGYRQGLQDIMAKPIGMDFQTGQSAALTRDASLKLQALTDVAKYYEAQRTNNLAGIKNQIDTQSGIDSMVQDYQQNLATQNKPFSVSEGASVYNPLTGKIEVTNPKTQEMIGSLTKDQFTRVGQIADDVRSDPDVKDFVSIRDGYERVKTGANLNNAQGDLSLLFGYMKLLDPNSVVRETEFANAEAAMGFAQRVLNIPNKFLKGERLTQEARTQFTQAADALYKSKENNYKTAKQYYENRATTAGVDPSLIFRDYTSTQQGSSSGNQSITWDNLLD